MKKNIKIFVIILGVVALFIIVSVGNTGYQSKPNVTETSIKALPSTSTSAVTTTKAGPNNLYPNPDLTPGEVFQVDTKTICVSGYSSGVRNVSLTTKEEVYAEYGVSYPQLTGAYEVDHFIPLELGGSNDIKNLWLEPASLTPVGFHQKDVYENYAHKQVCEGQITLQEAQRRMMTDWYKYYLEISSTTQI